MHNSKVQYVKKLGSGGFGEVHQALLTKHTGYVAIKELINLNDEGITRFKREVSILSTLNHKNIMPVLEAKLDEFPYWFAMPLADNSLFEEMDYLRYDLDKLNNYFLQIIDGMKFAHKSNVIHRDLKPQNILVYTDTVRISDFGLGKHIDKDALHTTYTQTGGQGGTPMYAAPEQWKDLKKADQRADIYSFGKMLYHVLTGDEPFPVMDINLLDGQLSKYKFLITKCTQNNILDRFQTMEEVESVFQQINNREMFEKTTKPEEEFRKALSEPMNEATIEIIHKILMLNEDNADLYYEHYPKLTKEIIQLYIEVNLSNFLNSLRTYDRYVSGSLRSYNDCDRVAILYKTIFYLTDDLVIRRIILNRLLIMGVSHNRYYVWDVFYAIAESIVDENTALLLKEILEANPSETLRLKPQLLEKRLLKILIQTIEAIKPPKIESSEDDWTF